MDLNFEFEFLLHRVPQTPVLCALAMATALRLQARKHAAPASSSWATAVVPPVDLIGRLRGTKLQA